MSGRPILFIAVALLAASGCNRPGDAAAGERESAPARCDPEEDKPEELYREGVETLYGLKGEINYEKALKLFGRAAGGGHTLAGARAGIMLYLGYGAEVDEAEGLKKVEAALPAVCRKAADGDADAQAVLGSLCERGLGEKKDEKAAFGWYQKAADQGNLTAMANLGYLYSEGLGVDRDERKGFEWVRKAAEKGLPKAMCDLGALYFLGLGTDKDEVKGAEWLARPPPKETRMRCAG